MEAVSIQDVDGLLESVSSQPRPRRCVSVVIVTYYTGPLLWRSIAAALAQDEVAEVIVVDNGNWDRTREELTRMTAEDARIRLLTGHGNVGFAAGCNMGAQIAKGRFLFVLNPDAILPRGAVAALLSEGLKHGGTGHWMAGGRLLNVDGTEQAGARRGPLTPWTALVEMTKLYTVAPKHPYFRRFNNHCEPCPGETVDMPVISGACMLMPTSAYEAVRGMDESFFLHVEDVDFCLRFRSGGGRVLYAPGVEVVHFKSSSRANRIRIERLKSESMIRYFKRHFSGVYPVGFLTLVSILIYAGFCARALHILGSRFSAVAGMNGRVGRNRAGRAVRLSRRAALR